MVLRSVTRRGRKPISLPAVGTVRHVSDNQRMGSDDRAPSLHASVGIWRTVVERQAHGTSGGAGIRAAVDVCPHSTHLH